MKKGEKKGTESDFADLDNKNGSEKPQMPSEDRLLEQRWKEFVKETLKPQGSREKMAEKTGEISKKKMGITPETSKVTGFRGGTKAPSSLIDDAKRPLKLLPTPNPEMKNSEKTDVKEHMETDVDKLYELTRDRGIIKIKDASKILGIVTDQVEEWGRVLEEHKLVRLRYPPVGDPVLILKRFTSDKEKIIGLKERKKLRPAKKIFIINLVILLSFAALISFYTIKLQTIRITYNQAYLAAAIIIIVGVIFVLRLIKKRRGNEKRSGEKDGKHNQQQ